MGLVLPARSMGVSRTGRNHLAIGRINSIIGSGEWNVVNNSASIEVEHYDYFVTCQEGCSTTDGKPIRPGVSLTVPVDVLDEKGEKVDYSGKVWEPDSPENLTKRWDEWNEQTGQYNP